MSYLSLSLSFSLFTSHDNWQVIPTPVLLDEAIFTLVILKFQSDGLPSLRLIIFTNHQGLVHSHQSSTLPPFKWSTSSTTLLTTSEPFLIHPLSTYIHHHHRLCLDHEAFFIHLHPPLPPFHLEFTKKMSQRYERAWFAWAGPLGSRTRENVRQLIETWWCERWVEKSNVIL